MSDESINGFDAHRKPCVANMDEHSVRLEDVAKLLHELQIQQVELELQNEELQETRAAIERGLRLYTELFDFAPIGYITLSPDTIIRGINHAAAHLLRRTRSTLLGKALTRLLPPSAAPALLTLVRKALRGAMEACEVSWPAEDAWVWVQLTATVLHHAEPTVLVAMEDISERKRNEARLLETERALRAAHKRKDEFLAILAHELRNPLAPIRNSLTVLSDSREDRERFVRAHDIIERQVEHLARLVDDLLDVSRITRGKISLHRERLELGALIRRTLEDHRGTLIQSGIDTHVHTQPALWIDADPVRLTQVLTNVLTNAQKFTPRGGRIMVRLEAMNRQAVISIEDTGVGIAPEVLSHVFEPFAQAPQTIDRTRGGLGLGLAMVKGLVELHGGSAELNSPGLNLGTLVRIRLPLAEQAAERPLRPHAKFAAPRRVLIIDDNVDAADSLRDALQMHGHKVNVEYDGQAGLAWARVYHPEVVICDIGLPRMDGYAVARAMRAEPQLRGVLLVALTGYANDEDRKRARDAGFDRHIAKPSSLEVLELSFQS